MMQIPAEAQAEILRLYKDEILSAGEIAKKLKIGKPTACRYIKKAGLTRSAQERIRLVMRSYKNPRWKGGRQRSGGYVYVLEEGHPRSGANNRVAEHIVVWEKAQNKMLPKGWVVHHINGISDDNRPVNLLAMPDSKHRNLIPELQKRIRNLEFASNSSALVSHTK